MSIASWPAFLRRGGNSQTRYRIRFLARFRNRLDCNLSVLQLIQVPPEEDVTEPPISGLNRRPAGGDPAGAAPHSVKGFDSTALLERLATVPRTRLASTPTPLLPAPALAAHLGTAARLSIKADNRTGLGLGGNKVRKLEYELAPPRLRGVTDLITGGGPHSNHCRVTAAAAARLGLGCTLVINGEPDDERRGNAYLHRLLGARIVTVADRADRAAGMTEEASRIATAGGKALVVPIGASTARGALGYVHALVELHGQADTARPWIFTSSSSGGTLAGLILGCAILGWRPRLVGVSADETASYVKDTAAGLAIAAARLLEDDHGGPGGGANLRHAPMAQPRRRLADRVRNVARAVVTTDDFVGPGYGHSTRESDEAIALFGARAGVILDPVYTGKAAAAMVAWLRDGRIREGDHAIFLHTGGHPALFR